MHLNSKSIDTYSFTTKYIRYFLLCLEIYVSKTMFFVTTSHSDIFWLNHYPSRVWETSIGLLMNYKGAKCVREGFFDFFFLPSSSPCLLPFCFSQSSSLSLLFHIPLGGGGCRAIKDMGLFSPFFSSHHYYTSHSSPITHLLHFFKTFL